MDISSSEQDEREVLDSVESLTRLQEQADDLRAENERLRAALGLEVEMGTRRLLVLARIVAAWDAQPVSLELVDAGMAEARSVLTKQNPPQPHTGTT